MNDRMMKICSQTEASLKCKIMLLQETLDRPEEKYQIADSKKTVMLCNAKKRVKAAVVGEAAGHGKMCVFLNSEALEALGNPKPNDLVMWKVEE